MIKYRVVIGEDEVEFVDENLANLYVSIHGGTVERIDEFTGLTTDEKKIIQNKLLSAAWEFITPYFDQASFIQITDWKSNLPKDHEVQKLISAMQQWKDAVLMEYLMRKKPSLWYGYPYDFEYSFIGAPPCSFTDMFLTINPQFKPPTYIIPDVSGYKPGTR